MRRRNAVRAASLAAPFIYSLALGLVGTAFVSAPASEHRASRVPTARAPACRGLSVGKQVKAVKSFAEMLPVFRHPRCMNCHGGLDPLSERHPGSGQLEGIDPLANRDEFIETCQNCHDELPGWRIPGEPVFFTGKSDEELCMQMKRFERTGESFVEHIENDHHDIQFIAAGFAGDRALGEEGLAQEHLVAEKPPGTQADLTAKAQKWVDDLEGHYADSPECGCVAPGIKLKVHHTTLLEMPNGLPSREASEVEFEVKLLPMGEDKPGGYQGELTLRRDIQLTVPQFCRATGFRQERWLFYAMLKPGSDSMTVWRFLFDEDPVGEITCRHGAGTAKIPHLFPGTPASQLGTGEPLLIPSDEGSIKELTEASGPERETLSITVVEVPAGE